MSIKWPEKRNLETADEGGLGVGMGITFEGHEGSQRGEGNILRLDFGDGYKLCEFTKKHYKL